MSLPTTCYTICKYCTCNKIKEWFNCKLLNKPICNWKILVPWRHKSLCVINWNDQLKEERATINRLSYKWNCMCITHRGNAPWSKWSSYLTFFMHWSCEGPSQLIIVCNDNIMWNQLLTSWISNLYRLHHDLAYLPKQEYEQFAILFYQQS